MKIKIIEKKDTEILIKATCQKDEFGLDLLWLETLDEFFSNLDIRGISQIRFNFKNISWIDSSLLRQLAFHSDYLNQKGVSLSILNINSHVRRVFELTHMDKKIDLES